MWWPPGQFGEAVCLGTRGDVYTRNGCLSALPNFLGGPVGCPVDCGFPLCPCPDDAAPGGSRVPLLSAILFACNATLLLRENLHVLHVTCFNGVLDVKLCMRSRFLLFKQCV